MNCASNSFFDFAGISQNNEKKTPVIADIKNVRDSLNMTRQKT